MKKLSAVLALLAGMAFTSFSQDLLSGTWSGKLKIDEQYTLSLALNLGKDEKGNWLCTFDSPDQGVRGIKAEFSTTIVGIEAKLPSLAASYKAVFTGNRLVGTFSQAGNEFPLTLERGEEKLNRPQTPQPPFPYTQREVSFENTAAGATLAGTLLIPDGADKSTPVVLLISGSGLENRDEEVFDHKPFLVIADWLARNGIASLRYDDRTFGKSVGGDVVNATTLDFCDDAAAALAFLRQSGMFGKIGVAGHSEGASIAFMLGASQEADFVISLSGIGVRGDEALLAQANRLLELRGSSTRLTLQDYRNNAARQGNAWINWFINYDPTEDIRSCKCPVFAVGGQKDIQIIASQNLPAIREKLPAGPSNFVKEYPDLNHLFQHCETGDVTEYRSIEETFSQEVLSDLSEWIKRI